MDFLDMLESADMFHHGALKERNFNDTRDYEKHLAIETVLPEYPDKGMYPGDVSSTAHRKTRVQRCAHEGCEEVAYKARTSRNWVCKSHQTKMNKDTLKRRLEERRTPVGETGLVRKKESGAGRPGGSENIAGGNPPSQFRPSLLEEVLNEKKMTLMRSPGVVNFLKAKQRKVEERKRLEMQLKCEPVDKVSSSSCGSGK